MSRTNQLRDLYAAAISDVTSSGDAWREYLTFAASIYKYSFDNSLLIYAQRPDTSMLAPLPLWNQLGRFVRKGEKSIAVCTGTPVLNHLFDVTQTTGKPPPTLWNLEDLDTDELAGRLTSYDTLSLSEAITQLAQMAVLTSWDEWQQDVQHDISGHFLGAMPLRGLEQHIGDLITDSVCYLIHCR
ncbi:hypothetical protein [Paenibacillus humicus]|uniref:hypothetical protein n=1 Tax=Paenibacillus humicus TaxID=412861 RepID=UPI003F14F0CD